MRLVYNQMERKVRNKLGKTMADNSDTCIDKGTEPERKSGNTGCPKCCEKNKVGKARHYPRQGGNISVDPWALETRAPLPVVFHMLDRIHNFIDQLHRHARDNSFSFCECALKCTKSYSRFLRGDSGEELHKE